MMKRIVIMLFMISVVFPLFSFYQGEEVQGIKNQEEKENDSLTMLKNPISIQYLKKNQKKSLPRLVFTPGLVKSIRKDIDKNKVLNNMYKAIKLNANQVFEKPLLTREIIGRRLLSTSREMLYRMNMLGFVYLMDKEKEVLERINEEVINVCNFTDWNPSHFLDVAEMSLAVSIAIDWTAGNLPESTIQLARESLIEKGIKPSWPESGETPGWVNSENNWNQVCNGGMIAASIAIADENIELASKTIKRALDGMPHALAAYGPDGIYPEGSTYWSYGTSYSVITAAMLESSFGHDFGILEYPAFKESAIFRALSVAPSGLYFNFADCHDKRDANGDIILAWFATKTGNQAYFERERFLRNPQDMGKLARLTGASMAWIAQYNKKEAEKIPTVWKGEGINPLVFFTGGENDPHQYYFGGKGGRGMIPHGNMDAGSFVFELNGVRWVYDPGIQSYHLLEEAGFSLWGTCQECQRWTLLTKNNFGHSTLTINNKLHKSKGQAKLIEFINGDKPEATFNMTGTFGDLLSSASRKFLKDSPVSLLIEDEIEISEKTKLITWQLITNAHVEIKDNEAVLSKDGKKLRVQLLSPLDNQFSVISLNPPPSEFDKKIEGLKRLEIQIPVWTIEGKNETIKVRLSGM